MLLAGSLVACSPSSDGDDAAPDESATPSTSESASPTEEETSPSPTATSPTETEPPPSEPAVEVPVQVVPEATLDAETLGTVDQPREEAVGLTAWRLPEDCQPTTPDALDMWTVTQGSGEFEEAVGVQQVAVFADSDAAAAAADELIAAMQSCTAAEGAATRYVVEGVDIGAQGNGLATDYYGASATGDLATAIGDYVAETRRGTAVTLVGYQGGESQIQSAGQSTRLLLATAWERLCVYDSEGC
ncbi:hypothetical protein C8046_13365 [Serinibacter arcticus]|uniref:Uncharacterized protein n=1 Tax=Serinibacter arcticus TaxID=1655435 RepID=A0A2U1ZWY6_9MICO|nr:hypothetical protein C8046_13365 [Serinibacter arcticus]